MRISRLRVVNYTRIPDLDLGFRAQVVLIGPNDVGKTCILRCLHFALGASLAVLYQNISANDIAEPAQPLQITVDLIDFTDDDRSVFPDEISVSQDGVESLRLLLEVAAPSDDSEVVIRRSFPGSGHGRAPTRDQLSAIGWQYLPAVRSAGAEGLIGRASALRALLNEIDLGAERDSLDQAMAALNSTLQSSMELASLRGDLARHLSAAGSRPIAKDDLSFRTASTADEMLRLLGLFLEKDGIVRPMADQSDGLNALAAIAFFDLASTGSNIVAIDEPETHLHPAAQRALAGVLTSGSNQKIISTHSPFIAQRFDPESVIAFTAERETRQLAHGGYSSIDKVLAQWWIASRLEPLTARRVVFVEGTADRVLLEACLSASGIHLDHQGTSLIELGGAASFKQAYRFFGPPGFNISFLGLVDEDAENDWANYMGVTTTDLASHNVFVSRKDLEEEYVTALGRDETLRALTTTGAFTSSQIVASCRVSAQSDLTQYHLIDFCGKGKNKVQAALAISSVIAGSHVKQMNGMKDLVDQLGSFQ